MRTNKLYTTTFALTLVLFIDGLSQGLLIPILTNALVSTHSHIFVSDVSAAGRNFLYGACLGIFFLCWFLGAPILGELSDFIGRKKALLLCLIGAAIGFVLTALAFVLHSISLLILSRIISGFTTGNQPIAQAAIIDICPPDKKAKYIALIIFAVSLGMIIGPIIGGYFSNPAIVSWFNYSTPLYIATALVLLNIIFIYRYFKETTVVKKYNKKFHLTRAVQVFTSAFSHPTVKYLTITFFILQSGWIIYQIYTSAYLAQRYSLSIMENSYFMITLGIGASLGFLLCSLVEKHFKTDSVVLCGYIILAICVLAMLLIPSVLLAWILAIPGCAALAVAYTFITKLFSAQVSPEQQGWVMGIAAGVTALAASFASIISGIFAALNIHIPILISIGLLLMGVYLLQHWRRIILLN